MKVYTVTKFYPYEGSTLYRIFGSLGAANAYALERAIEDFGDSFKKEEDNDGTVNYSNYEIISTDIWEVE